jgi:hypothetical protein
MEFKWKLGAGAAAAALLTACGPGGEAGEASQADAPSGMAGMAGEGGEGEGGEGEAGAVAELDPQAKAVADFLLIRGHTMAGRALYEAGMRDMARPHLSHPQKELYADGMQDLQQYGARAAAEAGDVIVELGEADASAEEVGAAVDATFVELDAAIANVGASVAQRAEALSSVLEAARAEYNVSITDGAVTDPAEFQDAWGFIRAARIAFDSWRGEFDAGDAEAAAEFDARLAELEAVHDDPVPDDTPPDVIEVRSGATQAQLALLAFQG